MRKVLLTTTALVALGGVSAASAVDVSGSYSFDYRDTSNTGASADAANVSGNTLGSDGLVRVSGEQTTDAGLTIGGFIAMETNSTSGNQAVSVEDQGAYISGDFGYILMGQTDGIVDTMDNFMTSGNIQEMGNSTANGGANGAGLNGSSNTSDTEGQAKIGYRSPVVSGFQFGVGHADAGSAATANNDTTAWIVTYDLGVAKLGYAQAKIGNANNTGADVTQTHYGASTSFAGVSINVGFGTDKTAGAGGTADTSKIDTTDVELGYSMDAASIYITSVKSEEKTGTNAGDKLSGQSYGLSYTIAPGASLLIEYADTEYTDATSGGTNTDGRTTTAVSLNVSF
jgi:hypothetical protein